MCTSAPRILRQNRKSEILQFNFVNSAIRFSAMPRWFINKIKHLKNDHNCLAKWSTSVVFKWQQRMLLFVTVDCLCLCSSNSKNFEKAGIDWNHDKKREYLEKTTKTHQRHDAAVTTPGGWFQNLSAQRATSSCWWWVEIDSVAWGITKMTSWCQYGIARRIVSRLQHVNGGMPELQLWNCCAVSPS